MNKKMETLILKLPIHLMNRLQDRILEELAELHKINGIHENYDEDIEEMDEIAEAIYQAYGISEKETACP